MNFLQGKFAGGDYGEESVLLTIAVLGGTGKEGKGLAYRWAKAGYRVLIGSRSSEKAVTAASEIMQLLEGSSSVVGTTNLEAAATGGDYRCYRALLGTS